MMTFSHKHDKGDELVCKLIVQRAKIPYGVARLRYNGHGWYRMVKVEENFLSQIHSICW